MDDPLGRIYRVDAPVASPGNCVTCGRSSDDVGFITFDNIDFEFHGTLYFCSVCVRTMANAMGYADNDQYADLTRKVEAQEVELSTLRDAMLLTEQIVDNLQLLSSIHNVGPAIDPGLIGKPDVAEVVQEAPRDVNENAPEGAGSGSAGDSTESGTAEPSDEQGPVYLRNTASTESSDILTGLGL